MTTLQDSGRAVCTERRRCESGEERYNAIPVVEHSPCRREPTMIPAKIGRMVVVRGACASGSAGWSHTEDALAFAASSVTKIPNIDLECLHPCRDREVRRYNVHFLHVSTEPPGGFLRPSEVRACNPEHGPLDRVMIVRRKERATVLFPLIAYETSRGDLAAAKLSKDRIQKLEMAASKAQTARTFLAASWKRHSDIFSASS